MKEELDWLTLDDGEEVLWSGNPKLQRIIGFTFTDYVVTDQALYRKSGILSRNVKKIGYDKIQNTSFSQGLLGKTFGYGNVEISTAGSSGVEMRFTTVEDPKTVQELVNRRIESGKKDEKSEREIMLEILDEVRGIRENIE
jgi:uncharacterized membrane protein YdbT with pleckstrin-like domain